MKVVLLLPIYLLWLTLGQAQKQIIVYGASPNIYIKHKVEAKENLYSIGRMYNISPKDFIAPANKILVTDIIKQGQMLNIPIKTVNYTQQDTTVVGITKFELFYYVQPKDQLVAVAKKMSNCNIDKLRKWNSLKTDVLQIGQLLKMGYLMVPNENAWALKGEENKNVNLTGTSDNIINNKIEPPTNNNLNEKLPDNTKLQEEANNTDAAIKEDYFKPQFKALGNVNKIMNIGFFNSNAKEETKKYYALINLISPGNIIKVTNPINGRSVYAQVLNGLENVNYNQGVQLRLSNNTNTALGIVPNDKLVKLEVAY
jgi:LysM repeat protein